MKNLIYLILLIPFVGFNQTYLTGKVIDAKNGEPLPFVNIAINNTSVGTSTDIDGRFTIKREVKSLQLSYVGYNKKTVLVSNRKPITIKLTEKSFNLNEVVINPEENPALRIIRKVIKNRKINDVEKRDYSCNLYNKFSMNMFIDTTDDNYKPYSDREKVVKTDSITGKKYFITKEADSIEFAKNKEKEQREELEEIKYANSTPMFLLETYVDKKHKSPNRNKELITASKMSGLKNPSFMAMATKIQSFSFYNEVFSIKDDEFLSPISKPGLKKYFYLIEDTLYNGTDSVFVISYRPYRGKNFNGMKGVLQISTNKFALKSVIAEPADTNASTKITIQQLYEEDENKNWVPKQLLGRVDYEFMSFDGASVFSETKTYVTNFNDITKIKGKEIDNLAFEIALDAHEVDSNEWKKLRTIELTNGENFTMIDSVKDSIPINMDRMIEGAKILMTGKIPYKWISFDLNRFLGFNDFEGVRLGAGLHTNKRLSKWFQAGGYFAYGFKDKQWKYGGDLNFNFSKRKDIDLNFSYQNDVIASGKATFFETASAGIVPANYNNLFINNMDNLEKYESFFSFRALKHFKFHLFGNIQTRKVNNSYLFNRTVNDNITIGEPIHFISEYGINIRFAFRETFYYDGLDRFSLGSKAPIVYLKIAKGIHSNYGNLAYTKYDFKITDDFKIGRIGTTRIAFQAGLADGDIPSTLLYNPDGIFKQFNISSNDAFETMRTNEFLSNKQANLFFTHKFKSIHFGEKFQPQIELVSNVGFGSLTKPEVHKNIEFKTLEKGYYESGIRIHHLVKVNFSTFGIGVFYRHGANSLPTFKDNAALKFVVGFQL